jgi:hypothetical protein
MRFSSLLFLLPFMASPAAFAQAVYPGTTGVAACQAVNNSYTNTWYIDPVNGQTMDAMTTAGIAITVPATSASQGSSAHPWNSLEAVFQGATGYSYPLANTGIYIKNTTGGNVIGPYGETIANGAFGPGAITGSTAALGPGPIGAGDLILLESGNYGPISLGFYNGGPRNIGPGGVSGKGQFLTIQADSGQTPLFQGPPGTPALVITASNGYIFTGIKAQEQATNIIKIGDAAGGGSTPFATTSNIVLYKFTVSSADPATYASWTQAQWESNTANGITAQGTANGANTTCVSITGSLITANHFDVVFQVNNSLLANNEFSWFGDDCVDYGSSNMQINNNYCHDAMDWNIGAHYDGFQGYGGTPVPPATYATFSNMNIFNNIVIGWTNTNETGGNLGGMVISQTNQWPTWLDCIDDYTYVATVYNLVNVYNNVCVTSSGTGILYGNMTNSTIENNTLAGDGTVTLGGFPYIEIEPTTIGLTNQNDRVFNNLTSGINMSAMVGGGGAPGDQTVTMDHNLMMSGNPGAILYWGTPGSGSFISAPGTYAQACSSSVLTNCSNVIVSTGPTSEFSDYAPGSLTYNMQLQGSAAAIGAGTATGAPPLDIRGDPR